jgi:chromosome partition protein MukB
MTRARAEELVLVNWKGCFFQRYLLDKQVTALEGVNGAGKTTVMIAAYVVLLPDMSRLRFTNLGETSPTGGDRGIFGRLGDPARPSYAAIVFRLPDGRRLVAGVQLERRTEPVVEPTAFVVTDLADDVGLEEVLLDRGDQDEVPLLERVRELATLRGGQLKRFSAVKEYFAELFDRGVTPLRLTGDEERTKLNEMLRTSMVGGISRALTGGLRDFLLKEETGLADTLRRMRGNLDACRQTRIEVQEAAELEEKIHGIYEAGQRMFAAAVHATRLAQEERRASLDAARERRAEASSALERASRALDAATKARDTARAQCLALAAEVESTSKLCERTRRANAVERRLAAHARERAARVVELDDRRERRTAAEAERSAARRAREAAQSAHRAAAQGVADFKAGYEEAERRAAAHTLVKAKLELARAGLGGDPETIDDLPDARGHATERLRELDGGLARRAREVAAATARRAEFEEVVAALERIDGARPWRQLDTDRLPTARAVLAELGRLDTLATELPELPFRREEALRLADRQATVRREAQGLSTIVRPLTTGLAVRDAQAETQGELDVATAAKREAEGLVTRAEVAQRGATELVALLEHRLTAWRELRGRADPLSARLGLPLGTRAELDTARTSVRTRARALEAERTATEEALRRASEEASRLAQGAGALSDALLRARDQLGGELLAARFEDAGLEEAPRLEALLGPLRDAILVEDLAAATAALERSQVAPDTVWLWDTREPLAVDEHGRPPGELREKIAVVAATGGARVTRIPDRPTLGRRARERRADELRRDVDRLGARASALRADERSCAADEETLVDLVARVDVLEAGDPTAELAIARQAVADAQRELLRGRAEITTATRNASELATRQRALLALLPDAHVLDLPDQHQLVLVLDARLSAARRAVAELQRVASDRDLVEQHLDVLRLPPPSEQALAELAAEVTRLEIERDAAWQVVAALDYVDEHRAALSWTDAEETLKERRALAPALKEQLDRASADLTAADDRVDQADGALEAATQRLNKAQAVLDGLDETITRARDERGREGVEDASDEALARLEGRVNELTRRADELDEAARLCADEVVRHEERLARANEGLTAADQRVTEEEAAWRPAHERWERLRAQADEGGLLVSATARVFQEEFGGQGSPNAWNMAQKELAVLLERLGRAQGGEVLRVELVGWLEKDEGRRAEDYLQAWLKLRDWLLQRIPAQFAEIDEPLEALERLRDHLLRLQERLEHQERTLRGQSEDVARSIDSQIRKARASVNRLNDELTTVRFGSVQSVRIRVEQEERMERLLEALRSGAAQQVLFQPDLPIEAAFEELFRRHGGGRLGGQRLLDYREYLDLRVEVLRQDRQDWEAANPTRLSTGEAIGVGAAVMMVVLTAWERDANLLRGKKSAGTLRLLFLDEATRLSQDNLIVLFELCKTLDLQLIIAAPEVAHGAGNTTYHLVRRVIDGREDVLVTGRRLAASAGA